MENQHQKITGYRELSQDEIDLMNKIKSLAEETGKLIASMTKDKSDPIQGEVKQADGEYHPLDQRWVSIAKTHLQQGFMCLTRAVAQPTTF